MKILAKFRGKSDLQEMDLFDTDRNPLVWPSASGGGEPMPFRLWPSDTSDQYDPKWETDPATNLPLPDFMSIDEYGNISTTHRCYMDANLTFHGLATTTIPLVSVFNGGGFGNMQTDVGTIIDTDTPIWRVIPLKIVFDVGQAVTIELSDLAFDQDGNSPQIGIALFGTIWALSGAGNNQEAGGGGFLT